MPAPATTVLVVDASEMECEGRTFVDALEGETEGISSDMLSMVACGPDVVELVEMVKVVEEFEDVFRVAVATGVDAEVVEELRQAWLSPVFTTKSCSTVSPALSERTTRICSPEATLRGFQSILAPLIFEVELNRAELTKICS